MNIHDGGRQRDGLGLLQRLMSAVTGNRAPSLVLEEPAHSAGDRHVVIDDEHARMPIGAIAAMVRTITITSGKTLRHVTSECSVALRRLGTAIRKKCLNVR